MNHAAANADQLAALKAGARDRSRSSTWALLALLGALFVWSYQGSEIDLGMLFSADGGGAIADYVERLFPPDLSAKVVADAVEGAWETLAISLIGTLLSVVIALSLAFFGSRNLVYAGLLYEMESRRHRVLLRRIPYLAAKAILNFLRTIPEMLWALVFVFLVGLGPFPGVLALGRPYRRRVGQALRRGAGGRGPATRGVSPVHRRRQDPDPLLRHSCRRCCRSSSPTPCTAGR